MPEAEAVAKRVRQRREGAGRKPHAQHHVGVTVYLPEWLADKLREHGGGNASAGARRVLLDGEPLPQDDDSWQTYLRLREEHQTMLSRREAPGEGERR